MDGNRQHDGVDPSLSTAPTDAVSGVVQLLRRHGARTSMVARWTDLCDRLKELEAGATEVFERAAADLVPALALPDAAPDEEAMSDLRSMARRLERTVESLVAPEPERRLDEGALTIRYAAVELASFLRECALPFESVVRPRGVRVEVSGPSVFLVEVDPEKLETVLLSVLYEACAIAPPGGRIDCSLGAHGRFAEICVRGCGAPSYGERDSVVALPVPTELPSPVVLGGVRFSLDVARDFAVLSGGALTMDLGANDRMTIRLRLPTRAPRGVQVSETRSTPRHAREVATLLAEQLRNSRGLTARSDRRARPLVLVAEDNLHLHRLVVESLEAHYDTVSAFDGIDALSRMAKDKPDLVVLDLIMPEMDGEEVIREARMRPELAGIPILVVTGNAEPTQLVRLLESGVQDVLHKPFIVAELIARANNLVASKRTRDLLEETIGKRETDLVTLAEEVAGHQRELREMLGALEVARQTAEDAGRIKSNFLRMMSHELRTPITAMELQLRLIERRSGVRMPGDVREGFDRIARSSKRLCHLVDTVLAWARVESGRCQLDVGRVDITALAREAMIEVEGYAKQKGITIEVRAHRDAMRLATDRKLVRLLVVNLVGRAVQVTESGSVVVEVREHSNGGLVAVSDHGTPIGPEEREASYSPLSVVGDFHRRSGAGSGLDLHVVRDIARAVEGDLAIESSAVGNTLTLFLGELPQDHVTGERPMMPERDLRSG